MKKPSRVATGYILVFFIYLILIPFLICSLGPRLDRLIGWGPFLPGSYALAAGAAALIYAWFWIIWSQVFIITRGAGHPNEIMGRELGPVTRRLVVDGPYRFTRNPMAYGLLVFYFVSLSFFCNSPVTLMLFPFACLFEAWYHTRCEEPGLLRRFGEEYENYRAQVPMLLPRIGFRRRFR